jgi:hypothetical protein
MPNTSCNLRQKSPLTCDSDLAEGSGLHWKHPESNDVINIEHVLFACSEDEIVDDPSNTVHRYLTFVFPRHTMRNLYADQGSRDRALRSFHAFCLIERPTDNAPRLRDT